MDSNQWDLTFELALKLRTDRGDIQRLQNHFLNYHYNYKVKVPSGAEVAEVQVTC